MTNKQKLYLDFYIILLLDIFAGLITVLYKPRFIVSTILFFAIPAIYLFIRKPRPIKRILTATFFFGGVLLFEMDFLAELNNTWVVNNTLISYKFFGIATPEIILWGILWTFYILVFYEHFFEHERKDKISPNYIYGLVPAILVLVLMSAVYLINKDLLLFPYAYFFLGLMSFVPYFFLGVRKIIETPKMLMKFFKVSIFFFFIHLAHELTAVKFEQWHFPGQFIGLIDFGGILVPIEEFFFWIMLSTATLLCYYEYYFDDGK